jgi:uncharacterized membrane protein
MADFKLSKEEEKKIIEAIRSAEGQTSGEIRVHIQKTLALPVYEEAAKVFLKLGMNKTDLRNGVLLFIVPTKKQFAILGDSGINQLVPEHFWADCKDSIHNHFSKGQFSEGICDTLNKIGEKLAHFFPVSKDDVNELSDEITYSE